MYENESNEALLITLETQIKEFAAMSAEIAELSLKIEVAFNELKGRGNITE
jgi:hypothetical protein